MNQLTLPPPIIIERKSNEWTDKETTIKIANHPQFKQQISATPIASSSSSRQSQITHYFSKQNTYLHWVFGPNYGQTIFTMLHSKYPTLIACVLLVLYISCEVIFGTDHIINSSYRVFAFFYADLWSIFMGLSINKRCFYLILTSFEFWFKLLLSIQYIITWWIYWHSFAGKEWRNDALWIVADIEYSFSVFGILVLYSSLDAVQMKLWVKTAIGALVSTAFTYRAFTFTFLRGDEQEKYVIKFSDNIELSTVGILASTTRILSIFFWKQVILSLITRKKGNDQIQSSVLIKYTPLIQWFDHDVNGSNTSFMSNSSVSTINTAPMSPASCSIKNISHFNDDEERDNDLNEMEITTMNTLPSINMDEADENKDPDQNSEDDSIAL